MVDVELLLSDNGGVRIYPAEWHNTVTGSWVWQVIL